MLLPNSTGPCVGMVRDRRANSVTACKQHLTRDATRRAAAASRRLEVLAERQDQDSWQEGAHASCLSLREGEGGHTIKYAYAIPANPGLNITQSHTQRLRVSDIDHAERQGDDLDDLQG